MKAIKNELYILFDRIYIMTINANKMKAEVVITDMFETRHT